MGLFFSILGFALFLFWLCKRPNFWRHAQHWLCLVNTLEGAGVSSGRGVAAVAWAPARA